ncbi:hypothetical protein MNBD_GAMMA12-3257 [hydrothermal vent metagenome]|uniref:Uncharacterized protein n=1 Tax=hydrothermal vent metagenome TaxID=652676 RepID=A0A3B0YX55_9ZZZZ
MNTQLTQELVQQNDQAAFDALFSDAKSQISKEKYFECSPCSIRALAKFSHNPEWKQKTILLLQNCLETILSNQLPNPYDKQAPLQLPPTGNFFAITAAAIVLGKIGDQSSTAVLKQSLTKIDSAGYAYQQAGGYITIALAVSGGESKLIQAHCTSNNPWDKIKAQYLYALCLITKDTESALHDLQYGHKYAYYSAAALADIGDSSQIEEMLLIIPQLDSSFLRKATVAAIEHLKNNQQPSTDQYFIWECGLEHPNEAALGNDPEELLIDFIIDYTLYPQADPSSNGVSNTSEANQRILIDELFDAIYDCNLDWVKTFKLENMNLHLANNLGQIPLYVAIENTFYSIDDTLSESKEITRLILDHTQEVNILDDYNHSPLFPAVERAHTDIIRWLLERNADPTIGSADLLSPAINELKEIAEQEPSEKNSQRKAKYQACIDLLS